MNSFYRLDDWNEAGLLLSCLRQVKHQDIPGPARVPCIIGIQVPDAASTSGQCGHCHGHSEAEATIADASWCDRGGGVGVLAAREFYSFLYGEFFTTHLSGD